MTNATVLVVPTSPRMVASPNQSRSCGIGKRLAVDGKKKKEKGHVRFNELVRVILVPTRKEYKDRQLDAILWWGHGDYFTFSEEAKSEIMLFASLENITFLQARSRLYQPTEDLSETYWNEYIHSLASNESLGMPGSNNNNNNNNNEQAPLQLIRTESNDSLFDSGSVNEFINDVDEEEVIDSLDIEMDELMNTPDYYNSCTDVDTDMLHQSNGPLKEEIIEDVRFCIPAPFFTELRKPAVPTPPRSSSPSITLYSAIALTLVVVISRYF